MKTDSKAKARTPGKGIAVPKPLGPAGSVSLTRRLKTINHWREQYNPLRYLTIPRAVYLIESYPRGWMADLQWTMGAPFMGVENSDADLLALIECRVSAMGELDWNAKTPSEVKAGPDFDQKLADEQKAAIREAYDGIDNLQDAIEHMAMARFRGYSHVEKWTNADGDVTHLEIVDQWNVVRDGMRGMWKYNPDALTSTFAALPEENIMQPENFIVYEVKRPVNRIALIKFIRQNLSDKDWDAFIEIYGIPSGIIVGPPNVPSEKEAQYESAAAQVAQGGNGYLPHGSDYKPNEGPRGNNPFRDRLEYLSEKLILAGTGGQLTMQAKSGTGTLAGGAHQETFNRLARSEAKKISEAFRLAIDAPLLDQLFPGQPHLAYFELAEKEETNIGDIVDHADKLARAGYAMDPDDLSERTGYELTLRIPTDTKTAKAEENDPKNPTFPDDPSLAQNRRRARVKNKAATADVDGFLDKAKIQLNAADAASFAPVIERLEKIESTDYASPDAFERDVQALIDSLPDLAKASNATPAQLAAWRNVLAAALVNGLTQKPEDKK